MESDASITPELRDELKDLATRDLQLWSIGSLVLLVLATGFIAVVLPNVLWRGSTVDMRIDGRFVPQLISGLLLLVVLFNLYLWEQRKRLNSTRERLVKRLMEPQYATNGMMDTFTETFNRTYFDQACEREITRAVRDRSPLTVMSVFIDGVAEVRNKFGSLAGDHLVLVVANALKRAMRGSDIVCRTGENEFSVLLPETPKSSATAPCARLKASLKAWNEKANLQYKLDVRMGVASLDESADGQQLAQLARERSRQMEERAAEVYRMAAMSFVSSGNEARVN